MFREVYQALKDLLQDWHVEPYLKSVENVPHDKEKFASLYLLKTDVDFQGKKTATFQLLVAKRLTSLNENELDGFESEVYGIVKKLLKELPSTNYSVEFGVSDAFLYAYIKFEVRFK